MIIMTGDQISQDSRLEIKHQIKGYMIKPCLAMIQIGNNDIGNIYLKALYKACTEIGVYLKLVEFSDDTKEIEIINKITELNNDNYVNGITIQLPISEKYNSERLINYIARNKDVDGLTDLNLGKIFNNKKTFVPSTPQAILTMCNYYNIALEGKNIVIINRSSLIGKPLLGLLLNQNATVTICHSLTNNLEKFTKTADIIITAVGKIDILSNDIVKNDVIIFDAGITNVNGKLQGDIDITKFDAVASYITSSPNGLGPLAITSLLKNVVDSYKKMNEEK